MIRFSSSYVTILLLFISSLSRADIALDLSSSGDLLNAKVGVPVQVDVSLSELGASHSIDFLAATISFDPAILGNPVISAGPIVPDPNPPGFVGSVLPRAVDGSYDSLFATGAATIDSNGLFLSFFVTPIAPGSTAFTFTFADSSVDGVPTSVTTGSRLPIIVVPETSSLTSSLIAIGMILLVGRRKVALRHGGAFVARN